MGGWIFLFCIDEVGGFHYILFYVTVACHVIPSSGRLVDVDIPELSESP